MPSTRPPQWRSAHVENPVHVRYSKKRRGAWHIDFYMLEGGPLTFIVATEAEAKRKAEAIAQSLGVTAEYMPPTVGRPLTIITVLVLDHVARGLTRVASFTRLAKVGLSSLMVVFSNSAPRAPR
jgi:hypothetical protein